MPSWMLRLNTPLNSNEEEHLCQSVYGAITNAQERFKILEGRDRFALQMEYLEWLSGDWKQMEVEWIDGSPSAD